MSSCGEALSGGGFAHKSTLVSITAVQYLLIAFIHKKCFRTCTKKLDDKSWDALLFLKRSKSVGAVWIAVPRRHNGGPKHLCSLQLGKRGKRGVFKRFFQKVALYTL